MGSNGGEKGISPVSLETSENQELAPLYPKTLCDFCSSLSHNFEDVGFKHSWVNYGDSRDIGEILKDSKTCPFCEEVADEFYYEWNRRNFGNESSDLKDGTGPQYVAHFRLRSEESYLIEHTTNSDDSEEFDDPTLNRILVSVNPRSGSGSFRPTLQFQRCSQPLLEVEDFCKAKSLHDWERGEEQAYCGRIRPLLANTRLFQKWKQICCATHGEVCTSIYSGPRPTWLRLIDVEQRCVVNREDYISYVALSYVWGWNKLDECDKRMPMLTKFTENDFRKVGSLTREKVLSTIDDAIEVTQGLGEQYIWVDCLCIMQDNEDDQGIFIRQMDSIYGFAAVTIIAAAGDNADAGLPGIKRGSRTREQKPFKIEGVPLVRALDPVGSKNRVLDEYNYLENRVPDKYHYLEDAVWLTRGWTFQEKIFSTRSLIFTEEQVYWECQKATWCEDGIWETTKPPTVYRPCFNNDFRRPWPSDMGSFLGIYKKLVVEYTRRSLTNGNDALDAFEGILNAWRREACQDFLWALPLSFLSKMLTWRCDERSIIRREEMCPVRSPDRTTNACPFPSWSWVGWVGAVKSFLMKTSSDLIFYYLDGKRQLQKVDEADDQSIRIRFEGCKPQGISGHINVTLEGIPQSVLSQSIASNILFFWSSCTKLQVRHIGRDSTSWDIRQGELICCNLHFDEELSFSHKGKDVWFEWSQKPALEPSLELAEFIVIGGDYQGLLVVLLVCWMDGVAYRQGQATVGASDWINLDPVWRMICLG